MVRANDAVYNLWALNLFASFTSGDGFDGTLCADWDCTILSSFGAVDPIMASFLSLLVLRVPLSEILGVRSLGCGV